MRNTAKVLSRILALAILSSVALGQSEEQRLVQATFNALADGFHVHPLQS